MPEGLEVEIYRQAAEAVVGRRIETVEIPVAAYARHGASAAIVDSLTGSTIVGVDRRGKLLLIAHERGRIGLRFGMTGRLLVDGVAPIARLEYSSDRDLPEWDRFIVDFSKAGSLRIRDPRRLGSVELDPELSVLGVDMFDVTEGDLEMVLSSRRAVKASLMDQSVLAGLGNLLTDEILWRAALHPKRPADSLTGAERTRLHAELSSTIRELLQLGGSHMGQLQDQRHDGGVCPKDGNSLESCAVGGRTTYSCPQHQRAQE
ncbi:MAG: DNA-formamidopyrimidine glycosylase family protein [Acidimicrobiales bacterium]